MTQLRDPFATIHKKDIKNKAGQVVAQVDYVGWSQIADRLDDAVPGWSFAIMSLGEDWAHGRLTFADGRFFENVGYAENADMDWKKEVLKDAVSDAFKRCAALAGASRYLYDKDAPRGTTHGGVGSSPAAAPVGQAAAGRGAPRPAASTVPPEPEWMGETSAVEQARSARPPSNDEEGTCPEHEQSWRFVPAGTSKTTGKAYSAFWACPERGCREKPTQRWVSDHQPVAAR